MKIAVLFDGAGLARLGLERAGHDCTGYELDPAKHYLSQMVGSGKCVLADVRGVDLSGYDAIWASPPCQEWSDQNHRNGSSSYGDADLLQWALNLKSPVLWVENVLSRLHRKQPGPLYNAVQFLPSPIQKRRRFIAGRYIPPMIYREYKPDYREYNCCPAVLASELATGGMALKPGNERRKASRWYGRPLSLREMAYHQGFEIPDGLLKSWFYTPPFNNPETNKPYTFAQWRRVLSSAIGNGVPVYMAQAFGAAYTGRYACEVRQLELFGSKVA